VQSSGSSGLLSSGPGTSLRGELDRARYETDLLFRVISPRAIYQRPVTERHRLVFYLGHLDAFDWNLLARRALNTQAFHPEFDALFERGIDPEPGKEPSDSVGDWPTRGEVEAYNFRARNWIDAHLDEMEPALIQMAIEHRLMHAETLAYLMHNLPYGEKRGTAPDAELRPAPHNPIMRIGAGVATLGQVAGRFGWDNEFAAHAAFVPEFGILKYKVSNGEYLEFVRQGGSPSSFWAREGDKWLWRGMFGLLPLPLDWPAWVTWQQADAYAKWRGMSLPSEAQWHRAASKTDAVRDNFGLHSWDPVAVDTNAGEGPQQLTGNGWEWTRNVFAPFEGFKVHPFYPGYSADFFDGKHYVLKGASPRTARLLSRPSFRNWFRPEYPYMYAGFRLVHKKDRGESA
jgi:iron(II)-dependent oxidoreductase